MDFIVGDDGDGIMFVFYLERYMAWRWSSLHHGFTILFADNNFPLLPFTLTANSDPELTISDKRNELNGIDFRL